MAQVSILIAAWRAQDFVAGAIASARAQTLTDIEIIVINDASPDGTSDAVRRAGEGDPRVKLIEREANGGPSAARNTGLDAARGAWIAVLDADDAFAPNRLETLIEFAVRTRADIVADDLLLVNETSSAPPTRLLGLGRETFLDLPEYARGNEMFSRARQFGYLKPVFRADFLAAHALRYDRDVRIGEDYMLVASALAEGARYGLYPDALYRYAVRGGSISARLTRADVRSLQNGDDRFMARYGAQLDAGARAALARRRASLDDAEAFIGAVEALKQGNGAGAIGAILRRPACVRHFAMPIGARLKRVLAAQERGQP